ncbi:MAG: diacylglycerol kinase family lipid kinase [Bacteroidetes bacterium]|nr:MAG: diacylglycerol kinase family lipid kinase [Bacteroidota bacterium]
MNNLDQTWFCVANPVAGGGKVVRQRPRIERALKEASIPFEWHWTESAGHAIELARAAVEAGYRRFVAIGGDGTGHEVVNGMLSQNAVPASQMWFTLLPIGTGNDWRRCFDLPTRLNQWVRRLRRGRSVWQDVGRIHYQRDGRSCSRYFINVAGLAYDGYVGRVAAQRKWTHFSKLMYMWLIFRCLLSYELPEAEVTFGESRRKGKFYSINAGICPWSGGGIRMVPHARPDDGLLALTLAGEVSVWGMLRAVPLFYNGKIATHPAVETDQVPSVTIRPIGHSIVDVEADGEYLGVAPAHIEIVPRALQVWV